MGMQKLSVQRRTEIAKYFPNDFDFDENKLFDSLNLTFQEITELNRRTKIKRARQLLCVYLFMQGKTLEEVGEIVERDHATALHSIKSFQNACNGYDDEFYNFHLEILREIPHSIGRTKDINVNEAICLVNLDFLMSSKVA